MKKFWALGLLLTLGISQHVSAKLVQILHTNDLHSMFDGTRSGRGGYARLKTVIDELKAKAARQNIPTLVLDAGDFGEGSTYYFSNEGVDAMKALDLLGVDVTVLGNHDFMMGGQELLRQINDSDLKATILSANFKRKKKTGLSQKMPDYVDFDIDGMTVRIFGLTTPEIHFQYPLLPQNYIGGAHKKGIKMAEKAQRDGVDFLIALTHTGLDKDKILASHSRTIDLIVGGHSHTRLEQPTIIENLRGNQVPIVQTGAHGMAIGSILIDMQADGASKMVDYRLYDITQEIAEDRTVKDFVENAYVNRDLYFKRSWKEVIGFSEIPLSGLYNGKVRNGKSCWSQHMARLTRTAAKAELGIQFAIFQGEEIPAGDITFGDVVDNFPHFRKWGDPGWNIARTKVRGALLKQMIKALSKLDEPIEMTIDGLMAFKGDKVAPEPYVFGGKHKVEQAMINGEFLKDVRFYTVALPSEIPYAFEKILGGLRSLIMKDLVYLQDAYYWPLLEDYIKTNSPLRCLDN